MHGQHRTDAELAVLAEKHHTANRDPQIQYLHFTIASFAINFPVAIRQLLVIAKIEIS